MTSEYTGQMQPRNKFKRIYLELNALFSWLGLVENSVTITLLFQWFVDRQQWQATTTMPDKQWINISYNEIVAEVGHGLTLRSTRYRVQKLEDCGLLRSEILFNNSKKYQVNFDRFDELMEMFFGNDAYPLYTAPIKNSIDPSATRGGAMRVEADPLPLEAHLPSIEKDRNNNEIDIAPPARSTTSNSSSSFNSFNPVPKRTHKKVDKKKNKFSSFNRKPKKSWSSSSVNSQEEPQSLRDSDKNLDSFCTFIEGCLQDAGSSIKKLREDTVITFTKTLARPLYAVATTGKEYTDYPTLFADHPSDIKVNGVDSFPELLSLWFNDEIFEPKQEAEQYVAQADIATVLFSASTLRALNDQFNPDGLLSGQKPKPKAKLEPTINPLIEAMERRKREQEQK